MSTEQFNPTTQNEELQTYLLNGNETPLTKEQAELLGAQKIEHSGDAGIELPPRDALPINHSRPVETPSHVPEHLVREHGTDKKKWYHTKAAKIAGVAFGITGVLGTGATVYAVNQASQITGAINDSLENDQAGLSSGSSNQNPESSPSNETPVSEEHIGMPTVEADRVMDICLMGGLDVEDVIRNEVTASESDQILSIMAGLTPDSDWDTSIQPACNEMLQYLSSRGY